MNRTSRYVFVTKHIHPKRHVDHHHATPVPAKKTDPGMILAVAFVICMGVAVLAVTATRETTAAATHQPLNNGKSYKGLQDDLGYPSPPATDPRAPYNKLPPSNNVDDRRHRPRPTTCLPGGGCYYDDHMSSGGFQLPPPRPWSPGAPRNPAECLQRGGKDMGRGCYYPRHNFAGEITDGYFGNGKIDDDYLGGNDFPFDDSWYDSGLKWEPKTPTVCDKESWVYDDSFHPGHDVGFDYSADHDNWGYADTPDYRGVR